MTAVVAAVMVTISRRWSWKDGCHFSNISVIMIASKQANKSKDEERAGERCRLQISLNICAGKQEPPHCCARNGVIISQPAIVNCADLECRCMPCLDRTITLNLLEHWVNNLLILLDQRGRSYLSQCYQVCTSLRWQQILRSEYLLCDPGARST